MISSSARLAVIISCTVILLMAGTVLAVPGTINYQGLLTDDGTPVDGMKSVRFRIYDGATGGTYLWEEVQNVTFASGVFSVLLGSTEAIPAAVFDGSRRWLSVSIDEGPEVLPRGELVSVGYAFLSATADTAAYSDLAGVADAAGYATASGNSDLLDGFDSSQFSGVNHSHDSRYYRQTQLNTSDGNPPNQGANLVHWNNLTGMPSDFSDGIDNTGETGTTDHGELTGLLDDDHPQYAMKDTLKTSDGSPPNQGKNLVHWNVLTGVPTGFADGNDNITTNASLITSGTMSPNRIAGVAVVDSDSRLLTVSEKDALTGGGVTSLHSHPQAGDIEGVEAGEGLSGGGTSGTVTLSHAEDATSLPFAHQYPAIVAGKSGASYSSAATNVEVVDSLTIEAPADGFLHITFSGVQKLDLAFETPPPRLAPKRYFARYGVAVDTTDAMHYYVTSSMQDTVFWTEAYVPSNPVSGVAVIPVTQGSHSVYLLTEMTLVVDSGAQNTFDSTSLVAVYFPYDSAGFGAATLLGANRRQGVPEQIGQGTGDSPPAEGGQ